MGSLKKQRRAKKRAQDKKDRQKKASQKPKQGGTYGIGSNSSRSVSLFTEPYGPTSSPSKRNPFPSIRHNPNSLSPKFNKQNEKINTLYKQRKPSYKIKQEIDLMDQSLDTEIKQKKQHKKRAELGIKITELNETIRRVDEDIARSKSRSQNNTNWRVRDLASRSIPILESKSRELRAELETISKEERDMAIAPATRRSDGGGLSVDARAPATIQNEITQLESQRKELEKEKKYLEKVKRSEYAGMTSDQTIESGQSRSILDSKRITKPKPRTVNEIRKNRNDFKILGLE